MKNLYVVVALCAFLLLSGCSEGNPSQTSGTTTSAPPISSVTDYTFTTSPSETVTTTSSELIFTTTFDSTSKTTTPPPTDTATTPLETSSLPNGSLLLPVSPLSLDISGFDVAALDAWYNDAVFIGDSISLGWRNYVLAQRASTTDFMGSAQFLVSGSLSATNSLWSLDDPNAVHPSYAGQKMLLWDAVPQTGAGKVFIMFGANDPYWISLYGMDKVVENFDTLLYNIKANAPDAEIILISSTYFISSYSSTSNTLRQLNLRLIDLCAEKGYGFINLADLLANSEGNLRDDYCSDGKCHLTNSAYAVWTSAFRSYAASRLS